MSESLLVDQRVGGPGWLLGLRVCATVALRALTAGMFFLAWYRASARVENSVGEHPLAGPFMLLYEPPFELALVFGGYGILVLAMASLWTFSGRNRSLALMVSAVVASIAASYHLPMWWPGS
ncbi:MAG: hypothetical protein AAF581_02620 [Planctomycetota bacterium]